ncbi:L-dopachrome tautomerase-related protein [Pseudomonas sp. NPDC090592]|uniref:L-dopachrome tautomerase-related protein n=1 Tax=Pseudomonas sp. NPDC090592 TaxID=3364480 RepID=UPI00383B09B4
MISRRSFCLASSLGLVSIGTGQLAWGMNQADSLTLKWNRILRLPWLCTGFTETSSGRLFAALPRLPGYEGTPSIIEITSEGSLIPFPGGSWNRWQPGHDATDALINVQRIKIASDDSLWVLDKGMSITSKASNSEARVLQFDTNTGRLLQHFQLAEKHNIFNAFAPFSSRAHNTLS